MKSFPARCAVRVRAVCGVQYISVYTLLSPKLSALLAPKDWWQSCIICIDYYRLWISEGQTEQTPGEPRDAVVMGTSSRCRATERKPNFSVSRSGHVMPVRESARFALPRRNFLYFSLSPSLSVLTAFPSVPSRTLLPWKHSRETVQDVAGAQTRRALFVRLEKEVGMDEILLWLDADLHSFWAKRQKSHGASTKDESVWD